MQRSKQWQHVKLSPSQSVNFNEHHDLKQWKLISQPVHNFSRSFHVCVEEGKEMKASDSLLTINQLSTTILLQSCSASLIWPLEYRPSVVDNWSNMTSLVLICRYSDVGKLMPTTKSGCISLTVHFDISYTKRTHAVVFSAFLLWVHWSCAQSMLLKCVVEILRPRWCWSVFVALQFEEATF